MQWKFNPKTGRMEPKESAAKQISKSIIKTPQKELIWVSVRTIRDGLKLCFDGNYYYAAVRFNGQWRIIGAVTNMNAFMQSARGPLVDFHNAWLAGNPISEPKNK